RPLGLIAKVACPELSNSGHSLNFKDSLSKLENEELLSLFATEIDMFKYLIWSDYNDILSKLADRRSSKLRKLAREYHPVTFTSGTIEQYSIDDQHAKQMKILSTDNLPLPARKPDWLSFLSNGELYFQSEYFVQPTSPVHEVNLQTGSISLSVIGNTQLLRTSPLLFLAKQKYYTENRFLAEEFQKRSRNHDFRESFRNARGNSVGCYAIYFSNALPNNNGVDSIGEIPLLTNLSNMLKIVVYSLQDYPALASNDEEKLRGYINFLSENPGYVNRFGYLRTLARGFPQEVKRALDSIIAIFYSVSFGSYTSRMMWFTHGMSNKPGVFSSTFLRNTTSGVPDIVLNPPMMAVSSSTSSTAERR
ncbi:hypothetical protein IWQ62_006059, partial [Dispira parvispora]